ncbi:hypothetical protein BEL04_11070 [Mucilaginibacter sp. PPCGB 2223]|uniref:hypothetical protein n=1 Tax=Mucilaginibacter sp. PPCGB 2223 TaxID=1886027 RepID=UPI0008242B1E|nr:hypothetical protein [Mucilaginibacter sp. PPCGB 2223]OCX52040.1 hypothetical protein BEL04_11070 [Mucilaginibacter sp. PPCGB 2223]
MKYFLIAALLILNFRVRAQQNDLFKQINTHIENALDKYYKPDTDSVRKYCRIGTVFAKFEVNKEGAICNVAFSDRSPRFITDALTKAFDLFHRDVELISMLKKVSKPVMLPFLYYYKKGCNLPDGSLTTKKADTEKFWETYVKSTADLDHTAETVERMLRFDGKELFAIDCILLSPFTVAETNPMY